MQRHEVTDEQWELLKDHFGSALPRGRPRSDLRRVVNGMLWIVRTGAPWRDLPERFGSWKTVYSWFNRWRKDGTWDRILQTLQIRLDGEGRIDWDLWCVDGSNIRASRAAAGAKKGAMRKSRQTTLWAVHEADSAANCTWWLTVKGCRWRSTSAPDNRTNRRTSNRY